MARPKKNKDEYTLTLTVNGEVYTYTGATILEALESIQPMIFKTKGILRIEKDGKSFEKLLFVPQMRRMFAGALSQHSHLVKQAIAKNFEYVFK